MAAKIPYEEIIAKIKSEKELSSEEIEEKVKAKISALSGLVSKQGAAYIVANELGIKFFEGDGDVKIKNIYPGMRNLKTVAKIAKKIGIYEFERNGAKGRVASFTIADETGSIRLTGWHEQAEFFNKTNEGDILKLDNAFVKENNGQKELHLTNNSNVAINPAGITVDVDVSNFQSAPTGGQAKQYNNVRKPISELKEGDASIELFVTIVDAFDIRFYEVCPECNKRTVDQDGSYLCDTHGSITPTYNYVMNIVVDDGSDTIRTVMFKNQITNLVKKTDEELQAIRENPTELADIKDNLLGETIKLIGRVNKNTMYDRLEFVANLVFPDVDLEDEMKNAETAESSKPAETEEKPKSVVEEEIVE